MHLNNVVPLPTSMLAAKQFQVVEIMNHKNKISSNEKTQS